MEEYTIRPILGLKTDVAQNDPSLFQEGGVCHCVDMLNVDLERIRNASSKSTGRTQYSATANAQATKCQGLFELKGASATNRLFWDNGKFYYMTAAREFTNIDAASPVSFGTADSDLITAVDVGEYVVMTDRANTLTPYIWKHGDANLTKLIKAGTEYKFRYLAVYQRRIIGAYSDQTNGDIEIRWTQDITTSNFWASAATFAAGNQLYKSGNDSITGIKTGRNVCYLYGSDSIDSIDYYPDFTTPFGITNRVPNQGAVNQHSIVDVGGIHYFFNAHYGFVAYAGGSEFPAGGRPISYDIEDKVAGINPAYYSQIVGKFIPITKEVIWAVPLDGAATPNTLLSYDIVSQQWKLKRVDCRYIDYWTLDSSLVWNDLAGMGYTTWGNFGLLRWADLVSSTPSVVFANTNGHLYSDTGESDAGAALDGYRVEPVISLGDSKKSLLLEIWLGLSAYGNYSIYIYYRGGDTEAECESAAWAALPEVAADTSTPVCYTNKLNRYHQIKWGTDAANEPFSVNSITFKYVPQGSY